MGAGRMAGRAWRARASHFQLITQPSERLLNGKQREGFGVPRAPRAPHVDMTTAEGEELKVSWKQSRTVDLVKVFGRHQLG